MSMRAPSLSFSSARLALCSPRGPGARGMTSFVLSPLRDSALEGPATGSAIGWDLIGRVLALSVIDMEKLSFYSSCFNSQRYFGLRCMC